jgi:thioredoxin 1
MKMNRSKAMAAIFCFLLLLLFTGLPVLFAAAPVEVPVKGMVTMIDLGATACIPCKLMAPILVKMEKQYAGRAAVVFFDVWKDQAPAKRFGIRTIPTQIFFDKDGKEVYRHEGMMNEEEIVRRFQEMGVK